MATTPEAAAAVVPPQITLSRSAATRIGLAGLLGTLIEYYQFICYGFLTVIIAPLFFPGHDLATQILSTFAVFATGYFVRPLGGLFFGHFGDKHGRKVTLIATILTMGISSTLIGVLPTYSAVGVLAPILLVVVRLAQGFSAGGELIGSVTYLAESAPKNRVGLYSAISPSGASLGTALAALASALVTLLLPADQLSAWGWRLPFLFCIVLTILTLIVRSKIEDSSTFKAMVASSKIERRPIIEIFRKHKMGMLKVAIIGAVINVVGAVGSTYITTALIANAGFPASQVYFVTAGTAIVGFVSMIVTGIVSQKVGRRAALLFGIITTAVYAVPAFFILRDTKSILVVLVVLIFWNIFAQTQSPPSFGTFAAIFPPWVRYTAAAFGFNIGVILGAGLTPFFSQLLLNATHDVASPAWLVVGASVIGVIVTLLIPKGTPEEDLEREAEHMTSEAPDEPVAASVALQREVATGTES